MYGEAFCLNLRIWVSNGSKRVLLADQAFIRVDRDGGISPLPDGSAVAGTGHATPRNTVLYILFEQEVMQHVQAYPAGLVMADYRTGFPGPWRLALDDEDVVVDVPALIGTQFRGGNVGAGLAVLQQLIPLGQETKAPCGGFVNCFRVRSARGQTYYLYSGVNEVRNSCHVVTLHAVWAE